MCGRYTLLTEEQSEEIREIIDEVNRKYNSAEMKVGEIFPTNQVPIIAKNMDDDVSPVLMNWGFPHFKSSGVIINSRSETVYEKPMFRNSMLNRRCVIPSTGFFEWAHIGKTKKEKFLFNLANTNTLYMAGLYNNYDGIDKFVILTTAANDSMSQYHNRMPVILDKCEIEGYIGDDAVAGEIINRVPPRLVNRQME